MFWIIVEVTDFSIYLIFKFKLTENANIPTLCISGKLKMSGWSWFKSLWGQQKLFLGTVRLNKILFQNDVFHCRGLYGEQVERTEKLQAHALKFMHVFAILTESLEDNTGDTKDINDFLLMLGATHASFKGFEQVFFL